MNEIKTILSEANNIVITTHKSPDGDAIGSSLALFHFLKKLGKKVTVVVPDAFPQFLNWMEGVEKILHYDKQEEEVISIIKAADLIFALDYNGLSRIGDLSLPVAASSAKKIVIDHHQNPQEFADYYVVDTDACSTSQLVYELIEKLGELDRLDEIIGSCIYCGIMTDTGSFRYPSTTSKTHQIIAHLIDLGVDGSQIHEWVYDTYSMNRLQLLGYALTEKMKVFPELNAAYISLSQEELKKYNFQKGDTEGLVNYPLSIEGIKFSTLITEKENDISMSFRSKGNFYVNELASENFDGGGHIYASGGRSLLTLEETIAKLEEVIQCYKSALTS
ncbi:MAG: bifunctional oligoribonuclease/PAP phosphatase NrnA [Vicingus serpentipes]|nr:bifunctional oligoribonuclease/PAP phosphatase NrnA [Vicingus serpentipes]